jgi:hypothetical protein
MVVLVYRTPFALSNEQLAAIADKETTANTKPVEQSHFNTPTLSPPTSFISQKNS